MVEQTSGASQEQQTQETPIVTTPQIVEPKVETIAPSLPVPVVPAGEPQTPSKTDEEPVVPVTTSKTEVQKRIDRMYARLQTEREGRLKAENEANTLKIVNKRPIDDNEDEEQPKISIPGLTESDVKRILANQKYEQEFQDVESEVLKRHPEMLNDDGTFNLNDLFCKKYIEIGKRNPTLSSMVDGPTLAEAQAEKELGISYRQGRVDEANNVTAIHNAHTITSTVTPPRPSKVVLTDIEKKMAARYKMTEEEYIKYKSTTRVGR